MWRIATSAAVAAAAGAACGGGSHIPDGPVAPPDATRDAGPTRGYRLAATGAQLLLDGGLQLGRAELATDVDALALHQDFYGVPWDAFAADAAPPAAWVAIMDRLAGDAALVDRPVFLSLSPIGGDRTRLAPRVRADGTTDAAWKPACYDLRVATDGPELVAAYARYVTWMIDRFHPRWVNVGIELNLFQPCGAAWEGMVDLERAAYAAAKAVDPALVVFPSIQIDALYGRSTGACPAPMTPEACYEAHYAGLARLQRDRFAVSTYPYLVDGIEVPEDLPVDWLTRAADRGGEALVIAETGWIATAAIADLDGACVTAIASDAAAQAAYLDRLVALARDRDLELVTWWSDRDLLVADVMTDCPCDFDPAWCAIVAQFRAAAGTDPTAQFYGEVLLKVFGTMGIRDHRGAPRQPIFDRWTAARAAPLADRPPRARP